MQKVGPRVYAYSAPSRTRAARSSCTPKPPPPRHRKWPDPGSCPEVPPPPPRCGRGPPGLGDTVSVQQTTPLHFQFGTRFHAPPTLLVSPLPPSTHPVTAAVATTAAAAAGSLRQPPSPRFQAAGPAPRAEIAERIRAGRAVLPSHPLPRWSPNTEARGYASGNSRTYSRGNGRLPFATRQPRVAGNGRERPSRESVRGAAGLVGRLSRGIRKHSKVRGSREQPGAARRGQRALAPKPEGRTQSRDT